ncbi:MAG: hypothetical protein IPL55_00140 [Saprospiraceae bacterium]|nr:hypothetical protein [Saprospiraceae bacterium]
MIKSPFSTLFFVFSTLIICLDIVETKASASDILQLDTIRYYQTIGYNDDSILFDIKVDVIEDVTQIKICLNAHPDSCFMRTIYGEYNLEQLQALSKDLIAKHLNISPEPLPLLSSVAVCS